jgi:hypothetical protein
MSTVTPDELQREIQERLRQLPAAKWVQDMVEHYRRTGSFKPQDLRRLLGDPNQAVEVGSNAGLATFFSMRSGGQLAD